MYTVRVGWPYPLQKLRFDATVNGYAHQQPTRMGIGSESAGASKGSAPYHSPAVLVKARYLGTVREPTR
jgi:hypothetical protein